MIGKFKVLAYTGEAADINLPAEFGGECDAAEQPAMPFVLTVHVLDIPQQLCDGGIGIIHPDHSGFYRSSWDEILVYQDYRRLTGIDELFIFRVGEKTELAGFPVLNFCERIYFCFCIAIDCSVEDSGEFFGCEFH